MRREGLGQRLPSSFERFLFWSAFDEIDISSSLEHTPSTRKLLKKETKTINRDGQATEK